jgi:alpha-L-fucosidase 2
VRTEAWSRSTASTWDEGTTIGTGVAGAVIYGDPARHILVFSHEDFFLPVNSRRAAPELAEVLPAVREALARRDDRAAADLIDGRLREQMWDSETLIWTDPLAPIAQLEWEIAGQEWTDYRRHLPLDDLDGAVSWDAGTGRRGIRVLARHGDSGFDIDLWSDTPVRGALRLRPVTERAAGASTVVPVDYGDAVTTSLTCSGTSLALTALVAGAEAGTDAWANVIARSPHDRALATDEWEIHLTPGRSVRIRVDVSGGRIDTDPRARDGGTQQLDAPALLARSSLRLGDAEVDGDLAVEDIWDRARQGDSRAEDALFEVAYAAGRRSILASTGHLPPTLQGVWQGTWAPAWSADYTMNGNLQLGALAAALWTGTPELMPSLFRLVRPFAEHYRSNARRIYGVDGMLLPARLTTHGHANHFLRDYPHQFWLGNGPWLLRLAADYILVTGDRSPIDDWLWEFAIDILEFSAAVLRDGSWRLSPSYSPENTPAGHDNPLATDAAADIAALRDGFHVGAWLADLVGDADRASEWRAARDAMPPFRIADDGTLAEWGDGWPENLAHRHVSQLQGLWYEPDPRLMSEPFRDAARETIRAKIAWRAEDPAGPPGRMEMAFGLCSIGLAAATLGDADAAFQCALWLARDHFTPALTTTHDAGAIFNVDAAGALPALVAAMLVGSTPRVVTLLPAVPRAWPTGMITGLGTRAGVQVAVLEWHADGLSFVIDAPDPHSWFRSEDVVVELPRPAVMTDSLGVHQLTDRSLLVAPGGGRASATVAYTGD